jgi:hypothetical protein
MKREFRTILIAIITLASVVFAQDPPVLPGAPNQGPIGGMIWLAIGGGLIVLKKYIKK